MSSAALTLHPTSWPDDGVIQKQSSDIEFFGFTATAGQLETHWYPGQQTTQVNINTYVEQ